MRLRSYPAHLSHSQVKSIDACGEQFRLERGYGIKGPKRWATVGGKGFHVATEFYDLAIASDHHEGDGVESGITGHTAGEMPAADAKPSAPQPEPSIITSIRKLVAELEGTRAVHEERLREVAESLVFERPEPGETPSPMVVELWQHGFEWSIAEELIQMNTDDLKSYEREGVIPDDKRPDPNGWLASGRATKAWPDKENRDWWDSTGPEMVHNFIVWRQNSGWQTAWFNGAPAIELDVGGDLDGIPVKAFLDRVELHPDFTSPTPVVCDIKSNKVEPADPEQLGVYATMLEIKGFPRPQWGAFYVARTGQMGKLHPLGEYTIEFFRWKYGIALDKRDNDGLVADTSNPFCRACGVREYCWAVGGARSNEIPRPWVEAADKRRLALSVVS